MVKAREFAKRIKITNENEEETNPLPPPPPPEEDTGGEASSPRAPNEEETGKEGSSREIARAEKSNSATSSEEKVLLVTIDPDALKCPICFDPLRPPIRQCILGHVACLSCWEKEQNKCATCKKPRGGRNIALEAVLESIFLLCPNANFGCCQSVSYSKMHVHTDMCEFGLFLCPIPGCVHKAFRGEWKEHFMKDHRAGGTPGQGTCYDYHYGKSCCISLNEDDHYYTLFGPAKELFLLVKEPIPNVGNVLSLFYVDLAGLDPNHFSYELTECSTCKSHKSPCVVSIKKWKRGDVLSASLLVPSLVRSLGYKLHVLINKK